MNLTVTEIAQERLSAMLQENDAPQQAIRVFAQGGGCGCSGPQFGMGLDDPQATDSLVEFGTLKFIADPEAAEALEGASIDYIEDVMQQGFSIQAPNAAEIMGGGGGCGCGGGGGGGGGHDHGGGGGGGGGCACGGH
jgi:iron-sulfur cluster assembly accessory protein